jgi:hypothetical protein
LICNEPDAEKHANPPRRRVKPAPILSSRSQTGSPDLPPVRKKPGVEESAEIAAQLIREIETLRENDLQSRAIAILKAKNRLSADDAKLVEQAFAARMALQATTPKAPVLEEPASAQASSNRLWHQRSWSNGRGGVPERSKPK